MIVPLSHLQPFQVDPDRVERQEITKLVSKIVADSKVSEIQGVFDRNISLCAYFLKSAYIEYDQIYFVSTSLIEDEGNRPDYICGCFHQKKGISWYAIIHAGPQEQTWDEELQLTASAKRSFDKLNYCTSSLPKILVNSQLVESVDPATIRGLLIIGQDREFFTDSRKQDRKRDINRNSPIKLRTYGGFLRKIGKEKKSWLSTPVNELLDRFRKLDYRIYDKT